MTVDRSPGFLECVPADSIASVPCRREEGMRSQEAGPDYSVCFLRHLSSSGERNLNCLAQDLGHLVHFRPRHIQRGHESQDRRPGSVNQQSEFKRGVNDTPPPIPLPTLMTSGRIPECSQQNMRPVRPIPVWISSKISNTPHSSA